jgi:hypothetical protein
VLARRRSETLDSPVAWIAVLQPGRVKDLKDVHQRPALGSLKRTHQVVRAPDHGSVYVSVGCNPVMGSVPSLLCDHRDDLDDDEPECIGNAKADSSLLELGYHTRCERLVSQGERCGLKSVEAAG